MQRWTAAMLPVCLMTLAAGGACAQAYPSRAIRVVTSEPGSGTDTLARMLAQGMAPSLGKQVVVDNKGGGILAIDVVLKSPPDGYTLLLYGMSLWLSPLMRDNSPYDPIRDFAPITLATTSPNVLVVHPSLPVESVKDLIALARARPGELNYGSGSTGAPTHLAAELFKSMTGINIVRIPYKGTGPATNALLGGQVQIMFVSASSAMLHVKSGKLKALGVTTAQPTALAPGLPTVAATGLPGYEATSFFGVFAPGGTPAALIDRLNGEILRVLARTDVKERLFNTGMEIVGATPAEFADIIKADIAKWGKVIKAAGIRDE